jgi:hypothetical protein
MDTVQVGDRVQFNHDGTMEDGEVISVTPAEKERPEDYWRHSEEEQRKFWDTATVRWDNGGESTMSVHELDPQDSELEREFRNVNSEALEKINAKVAEASAALREAVKISEKYGVPFGAGISFLSNDYYPKSFEDKFGELDSDFVSDITDTYNEYGDYGWTHSAVC